MTRFMLYNIYRGGEGRLDKIVEVVNDVQPDFLGVLEAVGWGAEDAQTLKQFARQSDLSFFHCAKSNTKYDLAFFSGSAPFRVEDFREGFRHAVVRLDFQLPQVGLLTVVVLHLDPRREEYRMRELEGLQSLIDVSTPVILMGDFNSLSLHDPYDRPALLQTFQEHSIEKFGREQLQFDCIERVESWGLVDVMVELKKPFTPTVPTPSNKDPMHVVPLRLDYVFISPTLKPFLAEAAVLRTPLADAASDHYPIVVDFSF